MLIRCCPATIRLMVNLVCITAIPAYLALRIKEQVLVKHAIGLSQ